jgi:hypothetical protein
MLYTYSVLQGLPNPFFRARPSGRARGGEAERVPVACSKKEVWVSGPKGSMNHEPQFTASGVSTT